MGEVSFMPDIDNPYGYIYITENLINGKRYIGQHKSPTFDPYYRGSGLALCNAFSKYGRQNFKTEILEWCDSLESLNTREIYWIDFYNASHRDDFYNISDGGKGITLTGYNHPRFGVRDSDDTRRKKSESLTGHVVTKETREKLRKANLGKKASDETKEKLRISSTGRRHSDETLQKMRDNSRKGDDNPARRPDVRARMNVGKRKRVMNVETGQVYDSVNDAYVDTGFHNISLCAREYEKGHMIKSGGFHWKYV